MAQLQNWVNQARQHWQEHQPALYAELQKSGKLEATLQQAALQTAREMDDLEQHGMNEQEAWEMTRESYLFPPEEAPQLEEQPQSGAALQAVMGMPLNVGDPTILQPE